MTIPINSDHVRGEGTWWFADIGLGPDADRIRAIADEIGVDLAVCGRGAKQRLVAGLRRIEAAL
ncbi:MAG: hypothetical protein AAGA42_02475 [Actinomycetota bacterium]